MSSFVLKIIACLTMFIDHISYAIPGDTTYLNCIGRFAFPIFAFQISEGYIHTKNLKNYFLRLVLFAVISQLPFMLFYTLVKEDAFSLNVVITLLLGLSSILIYDKCNHVLGLFLAFILGGIATLIKCDYGFYGVIVVFIFYILKENKTMYTIGFELATIINYSISVLKYYKYGSDILYKAFIWYYPHCIFTMLAIVPILLYNKKKGPNSRYLFYLFYPLHLILIYLISFLVR